MARNTQNAKVIYYNSDLIFTYAEAESFGISEASFRRALIELVEKGFLEVQYQGGSLGNGKDWSTYRLIDDWKLYGTPSFRPRTKTPAIQISKGFNNYNKNRKANLAQSQMTVNHSHA